MGTKVRGGRSVGSHTFFLRKSDKQYIKPMQQHKHKSYDYGQLVQRLSRLQGSAETLGVHGHPGAPSSPLPPVPSAQVLSASSSSPSSWGNWPDSSPWSSSPPSVCSLSSSSSRAGCTTRNGITASTSSTRCMIGEISMFDFQFSNQP